MIALFQKKIVLIASIITGLTVISGSIFKTVDWIDSTIVTKDDLAIAVTDIRLGQIEESLARYHRIGIPNLTDQEKHRYNKLILAEAANEKQRKILLGL